MRKFTLTLLLIFLLTSPSFSQVDKIDSLFSAADTTAIMDSLMKEFDQFLDSLATPKSFLSASISIGTGLFSFESENSMQIHTQRKAIFSPSLGYYHKSGLGLSVSAFMIREQQKTNIYQYALSLSYDILKTKYASGFSFSRYSNKDSVSFYTTPIKNEVFGYFSYKNWWLRPTASMSFGWGKKTDYEKRKFERLATLSRESQSYYILIKNEETVQDLSLTLSVRKDFDWYGVISKHDNITFTPVLLLNTGTQTFGFNTSYTYSQPAAIRLASATTGSYSSDRTKFAMQSFTAVIRTTYMKGNFMLQPQLLLDYYLPKSDDPLNSAFSITAAVSF